MISLFKKRIAAGRFPVPLRYIALSLCVFSIGFYFNTNPTNTHSQLVQSQPSDVAPVAYVPADVVADEQETVVTHSRYAPPRVSKKILAILTSFASEAGKPIMVSGVSLPEPRPRILKVIAPSSENILNRVSFLKQEGVTPVQLEVESGGTLEDTLMSSLNLSYEDAHNLIGSLSNYQNPKDIRAGQEIKAYSVPGLNKNELLAVELQKDVLTSLVAVRISQSRYAVAETVKPTVKSVRAAKGTIENSLYLAANKQNVPDRLMVDLIHAYSWSIDFQRDIRENDEFEIMFEEYRTEDGDLVPGKGDILYASLKIGNRPYTMFRHESADGRVDYFEEDGSSVRKALMTTPINGARISSGFGNRKHPVLGYNKMHKGMDFAAPRGTPIYASGDGVIEYIGRRGSFGNYIKIRHRNDLHSAYAHMKGFKSGLSNGSRVRQGDTIGYVGSTGRSTGPHLHYEVHLNGVAVNPKSIKLPTGTKLAGAELKKFKSEVRKLKREMEQRGLGQTVVASAEHLKTN